MHAQRLTFPCGCGSGRQAWPPIKHQKAHQCISGSATGPVARDWSLCLGQVKKELKLREGTQIPGRMSCGFHPPLSLHWGCPMTSWGSNVSTQMELRRCTGELRTDHSPYIRNGTASISLLKKARALSNISEGGRCLMTVSDPFCTPHRCTVWNPHIKRLE